MSGFKYKVYASQTADKGIGIFTSEFIPKDSLVWTLEIDNHLCFAEPEVNEYLSTLTDDQKRHVLNHIYIWNNSAILCTDDAEYVNHSSNPNLCESESDKKKGCWAVRDIQPNEELLDSYKTYETPSWYLDLCAKYSVESSRDVSILYN